MKFGVTFFRIWPLADSLKYVKLLEELGYDCVLQNDGLLCEDPFVFLTAVALKTRRVRLAPNVSPLMPALRRPALLAASIASLHEISGGRAVLGVGCGFPHQARMLGGEFKNPVLAQREGVTLIKRLLAGEKVTYEGKFFSLENAKLGLEAKSPPFDPLLPVLVGAQGPKMIEMTGEVADGIIFPRLSRSYYKSGIEIYEKALKKSGRTLNDVEMMANVLVSISDDKDRLLDELKPLVSHVIGHRLPTAWKMMGISNDQAEAIKKDPELVTDEMVEDFFICGTPDDCIAKVKKLESLQFNQINLTLGYDMNEWWKTIKAFGEKVIPAFKES